jgi:hypothetical protein
VGANTFYAHYKVYSINAAGARVGAVKEEALELSIINKKSISFVDLGCPCSATAHPPTSKYSTSFEFRHCINSLKSSGSRYPSSI